MKFDNILFGNGTFNKIGEIFSVMSEHPYNITGTSYCRVCHRPVSDFPGSRYTLCERCKRLGIHID